DRAAARLHGTGPGRRLRPDRPAAGHWRHHRHHRCCCDELTTDPSPEVKSGPEGPLFCFRQPTISLGWKKKAISVLSFSGESEPCTELASIDSAKSLRIVPAAALAGLVAPMISRFFTTAFSPSSTCTTTGPDVMKAHRSLKNGRSLCTA